MHSSQRGSNPTNPPATTRSAASRPVPPRRRHEVVHPFEALVQLAPDATVVVDGSGRIRLVNHLSEELFGYGVEELLGQPVEMLVPERLRVVHQQHRATYAAAPHVRSMGASLPLSGRRRDGSEFPIEASLGPLEEGGESLVIVSIRDITERQRLEQALAERVAQLEAVMEAVPGALAVYDTTGRVILANAVSRAHAPAGVTVAERIQHVGGVFDEHGVPLEEAQWPPIRALQGEMLSGANAVELAVHPPQGDPIFSRLTAAPLRDQAGNIIGAVSLNQDITERKRLERERAEARARELALEDVARHMDEFLATASHDLRTPLTVVKSRLQIALRRLTRLRASASAPEALGSDSELQGLHESLLAASQSADRLTRLVALLFDVSRARSGTLELQLAACDLTALVREQVAAQRMTALDRTIELVVPGSPVVWVQADADRLSQVLSNYLSNALKYSSADQPVTVRLEVAENQAVVSVTDHGPGLPPQEQSRIWDWFHRVPGIEVVYESGESSGNLGLGLHICKQLIELHAGGHVGVESRVGDGATFRFQLPLTS